MKKIIPALFIIFSCVCSAQNAPKQSPADLVKQWEEVNRKCSPVGGALAGIFIRSAGENSKQACKKLEYIENSLAKKGWCKKERQEESGKTVKAWQDCKPENLIFTPIKDVAKAEDAELINDYWLSSKNYEYEENRKNKDEAGFFANRMKEDRSELEKRKYCYERSPDAKSDKWRKCTTEELMGRVRQKEQQEQQKKQIAKESEKDQYCQSLMHVYTVAVTVRDGSGTPQFAYDQVKGQGPVSEKQKKDLINKVFFDREFTYANTSGQYMMAIYNGCMGRMKPLE